MNWLNILVAFAAFGFINAENSTQANTEDFDMANTITKLIEQYGEYKVNEFLKNKNFFGSGRVIPNIIEKSGLDTDKIIKTSYKGFENIMKPILREVINKTEFGIFGKIKAGITKLTGFEDFNSHIIPNYEYQMEKSFIGFNGVDCSNFVVECNRTTYNKYGVDVFVFHVADRYGKSANKDLWTNNMTLALHGFWPKDLCINLHGSVVEGFMSCMSQTDINVEYYEYDKYHESLLGLRSSPTITFDFGSKNQPYRAEYKRHFLKNGYSFDSFAKNFREMQKLFKENKISKIPLTVHDCRHDGEINWVQQVVHITGQPRKFNKFETCKVGAPFGFYSQPDDIFFNDIFYFDGEKFVNSTKLTEEVSELFFSNFDKIMASIYNGNKWIVQLGSLFKTWLTYFVLWVMSFYNQVKSRNNFGKDLFHKKRYMSFFWNFVSICVYSMVLPAIWFLTNGSAQYLVYVNFFIIACFLAYFVKFFYEYGFFRAIIQALLMVICLICYKYLILSTKVIGKDFYFTEVGQMGYKIAITTALVTIDQLFVNCLLPAMLLYFGSSRNFGYVKKLYKSMDDNSVLINNRRIEMFKLIFGKIFEKFLLAFIIKLFIYGNLIVYPEFFERIRVIDVGLNFFMFNLFAFSFMIEIFLRLFGIKSRNVYFCELLIIVSYLFYYGKFVLGLFEVGVTNNYSFSWQALGYSFSLFVLNELNRCYLSREWSVTYLISQLVTCISFVFGLFLIRSFDIHNIIIDCLKISKFNIDFLTFSLTISCILVFFINFFHVRYNIKKYGFNPSSKLSDAEFYRGSSSTKIFLIISRIVILILASVFIVVFAMKFVGPFMVQLGSKDCTIFSWYIQCILLMTCVVIYCYTINLCLRFYHSVYNCDYRDYKGTSWIMKTIFFLMAFVFVCFSILFTWCVVYYYVYYQIWIEMANILVPLLLTSFIINTISSYINPYLSGLSSRIVLGISNDVLRSICEMVITSIRDFNILVCFIMRALCLINALIGIYCNFIVAMMDENVMVFLKMISTVPLYLAMVLVVCEMFYSLTEFIVNAYLAKDCIKFVKTYRFVRTNLNECLNIDNNSNLDYLNERVMHRYDDGQQVEMTRLEFLRENGTFEQQTKVKINAHPETVERSTTRPTGSDGIQRTYEVGDIRAARRFDRQNGERVELFADHGDGNRENVPLPLDGFRHIRDVESATQYAEKRTTNRKEPYEDVNREFENVLDEGVGMQNPFEEFNLMTCSKFEFAGINYRIANSLETEPGIKIMSEDEFKEKKTKMEEESFYFPSLTLLENMVRKTDILNIFRSKCANHVIAKDVCDSVNKTPSMTGLAREFFNVREILVEQPSSNNLEFGLFSDSFSCGIYTNLVSSIFGMIFGKISSDMTKLSAIHLTSWLSGLDSFEFTSVSDDKEAIYSLEDYLIMTGKTFNQIYDDINKGLIFGFVSYTGQVYLTSDRMICANICLEKSWKHDGTFDTKFSSLACDVLDCDLRVRPFNFNKSFTISTLAHCNELSIPIPVNTKMIRCNDLNMFITSPMDIYSLNMNDMIAKVSKNKILMGTLAVCSGLVYCNDVRTKSHIGTASIFKDSTGKLRIITNHHVAQGWDKEYVVRYGKGINAGCKKFSVRSDIYYRSLFLGKLIDIKMDNLVAVGTDFAIFECDEQKVYGALSGHEFNKKQIKQWIPSINYLGTKTELMISCSRQLNNTLDHKKTAVLFRHVLTSYDEFDEYYKLFGYSTPGLSGSPVYRLKEEGVELTCLMSAMEATGKAMVHATRLIDCGKIKDIYEKTSISGLNVTVKFNSIDAIAPCYTEKLMKDDKKREKYLNGHSLTDSALMVEWKSSGEWPSVVGNYLLTSLKDKRYWDVYQQNLPFDEFDCALMDLEEYIERCAKVKASHKENSKFVKLDLSGNRWKEPLSFSDALDIINSVKSGNNCGIVVNENSCSDKVYQMTYEGDGNWIFEVQVTYDTRTHPLLVDDCWILEFLRSVSVGCDGLKQAYEILKDYNNSKKPVTIYKIGGKYVVDDSGKGSNSVQTALVVICNNADIYEDLNCFGFDISDPCIMDVFDTCSDVYYGFTELTPDEIEKIKNNKSDFIKSYSEDLINLRKQQKLIADKIRENRSKMNDIRQSYDYKEKKQEYDRVRREYNERISQLNEDKEKISAYKKQMKDSIYAIEQKYNKIISDKRFKSKDLTLKQQEARKKEKAEISSKKEKIQEQIDVLSESRKKIDERIKAYRFKIDNLGKNSSAKKLIDNFEKQKLKLSEDIDKLTKEKLLAVQEEKETWNKMIPEVPEKPKIENPEFSKKMMDIQDENNKLRSENKKIIDEMEKIQQNMKELKQSIHSVPSMLEESGLISRQIRSEVQSGLISDQIRDQITTVYKEYVSKMFREIADGFKEHMDDIVDLHTKSLCEKYDKILEKQMNKNQQRFNGLMTSFEDKFEEDCRRRKKIIKERESVDIEADEDNYEEKLPKRIRKTSNEGKHVKFDDFVVESRRRVQKQKKDSEDVDIEKEDISISELKLPKNLKKTDDSVKENRRRAQRQKKHVEDIDVEKEVPLISEEKVPKFLKKTDNDKWSEVVRRRAVKQKKDKESIEYERDEPSTSEQVLPKFKKTLNKKIIDFESVEQIVDQDLIGVLSLPMNKKTLLQKFNTHLDHFDESVDSEIHVVKISDIMGGKVINFKIDTKEKLKEYFKLLNLLYKDQKHADGTPFTIYPHRYERIMNGSKNINDYFNSKRSISFDICNPENEEKISWGQLLLSSIDNDEELNEVRNELINELKTGKVRGIKKIRTYAPGKWSKIAKRFFAELKNIHNADWLQHPKGHDSTVEDFAKNNSIIINMDDDVFKYYTNDKATFLFKVFTNVRQR